MPNPVRLQQIADLRRVGLRLKCDIAWLRCILALKRFANAAIKANFNPGQLRIPAGQPGGGQWTDGGGGGLTLVGARGRMSVSVRVRGRQMEVTPAQATGLPAPRLGLAMQRIVSGKWTQHGARRQV